MTTMTRTWTRTDLPWANTLVDLRRNTDLTELPHTLPPPVPHRSIIVGDYTAVPYVVPGGPEGGSTSILLLNAPDGWVGAIVLPQYTGKRFAFQYLTKKVPYLGRLMSPGNSSARTLSYLRALTIEALPMLRDALIHPRTWGTADILELDTTDPDFVVHTLEYVLLWASANVTVQDAAILEDYQLRPLDTRYAHRGDLQRWHTAGWTDPHDVALWVQAGANHPTRVKDFTVAGFTPQLAFDWHETPVPPEMGPDITMDFINAGWTPDGVRDLGAVIAANQLTSGHKPTFYESVNAWVTVMEPSLACAYLRAGITPTEAALIEQTSGRPDEATLVFMNAWTTPKPHWRFPHFRTGAPCSPHHTPQG